MIGYVTLGTNDIEKAAGFYDALLGERDAGLSEVIRVARTAVGKGRSHWKTAERGAELVYSLLVIGLAVGFATLNEEAICFGYRFLAANDLALGEAAHSGIRCTFPRLG